MTVSLLDPDVIESVEESDEPEELDHWACAQCYPLMGATPGLIRTFCGLYVEAKYIPENTSSCTLCEIISADHKCPVCGATFS